MKVELVDMRMSLRAVIGLFLLAIVSANRFEAYDCSSPKNSKFFEHSTCSLHSGHTQEKKFLIYQNEIR